MRFVLIFQVVVTLALADVTRYDGYKVYTVTPHNEDQASQLNTLENVDAYDFWTEVRTPGRDNTVMVAPNEQENFKWFLKNRNIAYHTLIEDVQITIDNERQSQEEALEAANGSISFMGYNTMPTIEAYLKNLTNSSYSEIVTLKVIGHSFERQPIYLLKISCRGEYEQPTPKPIILIDAGIHAREWIATATVLYIIQQLVENEDNRNLILFVDWHIIPILNPDGYRYSYSMEGDRFWRKTRSSGSQCYGTDANRNFDFHWMEVGASSSECDETYGGPKAFSENETVALRNYLSEHDGTNTKLYLTFHSFGQYLLYPWNYNSSLLPEDADVLDSLGKRVAAAITASNGSIYEVGSSANVLHEAAGSSQDYVKSTGGIDLSYTIHLPGGGSSGFDVPTDRILPVVQETFEGLKEFHAYIEETYASTTI